MQKLLLRMLTGYIILAIIACVYVAVSSNTKDDNEAVVAEGSGDEWYDADVRSVGENSDEATTEKEPEVSETEETEIKPDENFQKFEIEDEEEEEIPDDEAFTVTTDKVNIREEGASSGKIATVILRGQVARMIEPGESWSYVEFEGLRGYIGNKYLVFKSENPEVFQKWVDYYEAAELEKAKNAEEEENSEE